MELFKLFSDLGGALFTVLSVGFVIIMTVRQFMIKDRPTRVHIAMHFLRPMNGRLKLKMPTMRVVWLPELYDYITATWLLLCSSRWARRSPYSPIIHFPVEKREQGGFWSLLPCRSDFLRPILQWLSMENFTEWRDRAVAAARDPNADPQEELFVVCLVYENASKSIRGIVVPVRVLERFLSEPESIDEEPHPNYEGAKDRPQILRIVAKAWAEWKEGKHPGLAMAILEL